MIFALLLFLVFFFFIVSLKVLICSSKSDLTCASTVLLSELPMDSRNFFDVVELKSPSELRRLICLAIPDKSSGLSGLQLFLERIGLEGVSVLISELFSIDVFGWELDKSKFVSELLMSLFTFMDATIVVTIDQYCLQLTNMKNGIKKIQ